MTFEILDVSAAVSVMCFPMMLLNGKLIAVVELYRNWDGAPYTTEMLTMSQVRKFLFFVKRL